MWPSAAKYYGIQVAVDLKSYWMFSSCAREKGREANFYIYVRDRMQGSNFSPRFSPSLYLSASIYLSSPLIYSPPLFYAAEFRGGEYCSRRVKFAQKVGCDSLFSLFCAREHMRAKLLGRINGPGREVSRKSWSEESEKGIGGLAWRVLGRCDFWNVRAQSWCTVILKFYCLRRWIRLVLSRHLQWKVICLNQLMYDCNTCWYGISSSLSCTVIAFQTVYSHLFTQQVLSDSPSPRYKTNYTRDYSLLGTTFQHT